MKKERIHPEITCPYCRIGFGGHKKSREDKIVHLDVMWCYEYALQRDCQQKNINELISEVDDHGNPKFTEEYSIKFKELREKFERNPDDISKDTCSFDEYYISFVECMNWGELDSEEEEYDREKISGEKLKELYDSGINLEDALKSFLIKIK